MPAVALQCSRIIQPQLFVQSLNLRWHLALILNKLKFCFLCEIIGQSHNNTLTNLYPLIIAFSGGVQIAKFKGGVHPSYSKLTADQKIKRAKLPGKVVLPLHQHVGAPCDPLVEKGERVKTGQKIAESKAPVSAPIHASISGAVVDISPALTPVGKKSLAL
jgi:hypothetical protein